MSVFLTIEAETGKVERALQFGITGVTDYRPVFAALVEPWAASRRKMYATRGASTGALWPVYQPEERRYAAVKGKILGRRMRASDLLRWRGGTERLYPSLTNPADAQFVALIAPRSASFGTSVPYAIHHERGGYPAPKWAGGYPIPRRRVLGVGADFTRGVRQALGTHAANIGQAISLSTVDALRRPIRGVKS